MKKISYVLIILGLLTIPILGCSQDSEHQNMTNPNTNENDTELSLQYVIGSNDWSAITSITDNKAILEAYQFAVEHPEVLNYMPCYCGCYEEAGHVHNTHCFVQKVENDVAQLDSMGFG